MRRTTCFLVIIVACLLLVVSAGCGHSTATDPLGLKPGPQLPSRPGAHVWAVGDPFLVLASDNGGHTWTTQHRGTQDLDDTLWSVAFSDVRHGWAVTRWDSKSRWGAIIATTDGGATWVRQHPPTSGRLLAVTCADALHAWAAGSTKSSDGRALILATSDGGMTWKRQPFRAPGAVISVAFADSRNGWAVAVDGPGSSGTVGDDVLVTKDGGLHWHVQYAAQGGPAPSDSLTSLSAPDSRHAWVVGYDVHFRGLILSTRDGGSHWKRQLAGSAGLQDVAFVDKEHGWAGGSGGAILTTADGGATWSRQRYSKSLTLSRVAFSDARHGWAVIQHSALLATGDGGHTWTVVEPFGRRDLLIDVAAVN